MSELTLATETWRAVVGWEGFYEVSNQGRVRSLDRLVAMNPRTKYLRRGQIVQSRRQKSGHRRVTFKLNDVKDDRGLHRVVLESFVGPCPEGMEGCHGDGDPTNNRVENLRWDTHTGNLADMRVHGTHHCSKKETCPRGHLLAGANLHARHLKGEGRKCLACHRAHRRRGNSRDPNFDLVAVANECYREIMAA